MLLNSFIFAIQVTLPISIIICLGIFLKRIKLINNEFADMGSALVFNITLPCLLFVNIVEYDFAQALPLKPIIFGVAFTCVLFILLSLSVKYVTADHLSRGVFVQGCYRSNMGIIGLAYVFKAYDADVLAMASLYLAVVTIFFNIFSVLTLNYYAHGETRVQSIGLKLLSNPLIITTSAALFIAYQGWSLPSVMLDTGRYFASMTLPLALLCSGASIRWREFRSSGLLYVVVVLKLFFIPAIAVMAAYALGLRNESLGIIYLMTAPPSAAAGYIMVKTIGGNAYLAAAIVGATTIASIFSTTLGLFILRALGLL